MQVTIDQSGCEESTASVELITLDEGLRSGKVKITEMGADGRSRAINPRHGESAEVNRLALTVRRLSDNAAIAATEQAQGTRINAGGSATVPLALHFDATAAESNMKVVSLEGSDANGHQIASTIEIEVRAS